MSNLKKCREIYSGLITDLELFVAGSRPHTLEKNLDRAWGIQETQPQFTPILNPGANEYAARVCKDLAELAQLRNRRSNRVINESMMSMSSETDAFFELQAIRTIFSDLVFPAKVGCGDFNSKFVQGMLRELPNLSLAYSHSVVQSAADEFVPEEQVYEAKLGSLIIAREAFDFRTTFCSNRDVSQFEKITDQFGRFDRALQTHGTPQFLRDFKLTFVAPKRIYKKEECVKSLFQQIIKNEEYLPRYLVPVAQGGIELSVLFDSAYRAQGHEPLNYPIMYSIKTRKHRRPWTDLDGVFFEKIMGEDLLVTEDWITTGTTVRGVLADLVSSLPGQIRFATLKRDPKNMSDPILKNQWIYAGMVASYGGTKTSEIDNTNQKGFNNDC